MMDFQQGPKFAYEKCVIHFKEYLTNLFLQIIFEKKILRKEKKLKARNLCFLHGTIRSKAIEQP